MVRKSMNALLMICVLVLAVGTAGAGSTLEPSKRERARAEKEVERGNRKAARGRSHAALEHFLYALELDPFSAGARAGLDALVGRSEAGSAAAGCPERTRSARGPSGSGRAESPVKGPVLGHVPEAPRGDLREGGPHYESARPYLRLVQQVAAKHHVDVRLILAVIKAESNFNPRARSQSGARGLMQLMPATAARFGAHEIDDPAQNIDAGTRYLRHLLDLFKGDVDRALAGYVAGEMTVVKHGGVPRDKRVQTYIRQVRTYATQF